VSGRRPLYSLALRELHAAAGAVVEERSGWLVPSHYGDPEGEYEGLRQRAAIFDRSWQARFIVSGPDAGDVLSAVFAGPVGGLEEGRAKRAVRLDEAGNIRDLALIARMSAIAYLVTGAPGQRAETLAALSGAAGPGFDARVEDRTETTCLLALSGPGAAETVRRHLAEGLPARLDRLRCAAFEFHGFRALALRMSETGEDGFELMLAPAVAQHVIEALRAEGVVLAGDLAYETARVEACVPAFEPDLVTGLTPAQADLDVALGVAGGEEGVILSALLLEAPAPVEPGTPVLAQGRTVGEVRSSVRSMAGGATIGLAIIDTEHAYPGAALQAAAAGASVVAKPFYRRRRPDGHTP
jgi:aminomethyltransferase